MRRWKRPRSAQRQWQERWEAFNRELGGTYQTTQVERTRIEQLDDQLRRLAAQSIAWPSNASSCSRRSAGRRTR